AMTKRNTRKCFTAILLINELRREVRALQSTYLGGLFRCLRRGVPVIGIVSPSVLPTLLAQRTLNPPAAAAQSSQPEEVRASMFTLVGPEGTVLARLEPGADGNGRLQLLDTNGTVRVALSGDALLRLFD